MKRPGRAAELHVDDHLVMKYDRMMIMVTGNSGVMVDEWRELHG